GETALELCGRGGDGGSAIEAATTATQGSFLRWPSSSAAAFSPDKEKELKRDYRLLKDAKSQSGAHFDEKTGRITAAPAVWANILISHPKAKKFRNKSFPLYEALGELYDGQTAEGTYNYTSTQVPDLTQAGNGSELLHVEQEGGEEALVGQEEDDVQLLDEGDDVHVHEGGHATGERPVLKTSVAVARRNSEETGSKRQKKS
ncbi:unnamed protein product, partial [Urochloa humidicola]